MKRPATMASQIGFQSLDKSKPNKNKKVKKRSEFTNLLRSCVSKTKSRARNDSETTLPLTFVNKKKKKRKRKRRKVFGFFSDPHCRPKKMARFLILPPIFMIFVRFKKNDFRLAEGKVSRCRSSSRSFLLFFFRRQFYFIAVVPACFVRAPFFFFFFLFFFFLIIFVLVCAGLWFVLESSRAVTAKGRPVLRHRMKIVRFFFRRNFTHLLIDRQRRLQ